MPEIGARPWTSLRRDVDGDHRADRRIRAHHLHREVVEHAAVDQQVTLERDRREHTGNGDARPDRHGARTTPVDVESRGRQVRRHAVERQPQILDVERPEVVVDVLADALALEEGDDRHGVVEQPVELLLGQRDQFGIVQVERDAAGDRRAHRAPAHGVDRHPRLAQRPQRAEVGEPASPTTAQHESDTVPAGQPGQPADVVVTTGAEVHHLVGADLREQSIGPARTVGVRRMHDRHHPPDVFDVGELTDELADPLMLLRPRTRGHDQQHPVRLPQGATGPAGQTGVGLEDHVVVADVGFVHQLRQPRDPDLVGGRLRDAGPVEHPVDPLAREVADRTEPGDLGDDRVEQRRRNRAVR